MPSIRPRPLIALAYEEAAQAYLRSLPLEHFMEATSQAKQREITLESLALVKAVRPDVQVFNELLVQYPVPRQARLGQVVPDNMVVVCAQPIKANTSYNLPLEPARPFWVLEYVSRSNKRKDYEDNFDKYEKQLKVPYFLMFHPEDQEITLYHHTGRRYVAVKPNEQGRYALPELELEIGLHEGWTRFWFRGELLPLPADLQRELNEAKRQVAQATKRADELQGRLESALRELAQLRGQEQAPPTRRNNGSKQDK
jgi:Uma2 family endonuclease